MDQPIAVKDDVATQPVEVLRAARKACLIRRPSTSEAQKAIEELTDNLESHEIDREMRERNRSLKARRAFKQALSAWVGDLLVEANNHEAQGFCYHPVSAKGLEGTLASRGHSKAVLDVLGKSGLAHRYNHMHTQNAQKAARYRATPELLKRFKQVGIIPANAFDHFKVDLSHFEPLSAMKRSEGWGNYGNKTPTQPLLGRILLKNSCLIECLFADSIVLSNGGNFDVGAKARSTRRAVLRVLD